MPLEGCRRWAFLALWGGCVFCGTAPRAPWWGQDRDGQCGRQALLAPVLPAFREWLRTGTLQRWIWIRGGADNASGWAVCACLGGVWGCRGWHFTALAAWDGMAEMAYRRQAPCAPAFWGMPRAGTPWRWLCGTGMGEGGVSAAGAACTGLGQGCRIPSDGPAGKPVGSPGQWETPMGRPRHANPSGAREGCAFRQRVRLGRVCWKSPFPRAKPVPLQPPPGNPQGFQWELMGWPWKGRTPSSACMPETFWDAPGAGGLMPFCASFSPAARTAGAGRFCRRRIAVPRKKRSPALSVPGNPMSPAETDRMPAAGNLPPPPSRCAHGVPAGFARLQPPPSVLPPATPASRAPYRAGDGAAGSSRPPMAPQATAQR